ncbi:MAG: thioredoxin domain-containing protein [Erythrobacter sp.]|nr:MAG: thioredoxin domain-containing protein [Erythrobacter sp.]
MTISPRLALFALAAPLALAACNGGEGEVAESEPIAAIAAPEGSSWTETVAVSEYDGYVLGNPEAPIKVVEYASLTCPACAAFAQTGADPLKEEYVSTGVVSFELRNQVHNVFDLTLARLVRCGAPESFHPLSQQVWLNLAPLQQQMQAGSQALQGAEGLPPEQLYPLVAEASGFYDFFAARGISRDQAATCLADAASVDAIGDRSDQQSEEFEVTGTPTFFVNGTKVDGINWEDLEPVLQRAGARTE